MAALLGSGALAQQQNFVPINVNQQGQRINNNNKGLVTNTFSSSVGVNSNFVNGFSSAAGQSSNNFVNTNNGFSSNGNVNFGSNNDNNRQNVNQFSSNGASSFGSNGFSSNRPVSSNCFGSDVGCNAQRGNQFSSNNNNGFINRLPAGQFSSVATQSANQFSSNNGNNNNNNGFINRLPVGQFSSVPVTNGGGRSPSSVPVVTSSVNNNAFRATPANARDARGTEIYPGCNGTVCLPEANLCAIRKQKGTILLFNFHFLKSVMLKTYINRSGSLQLHGQELLDLVV